MDKKATWKKPALIAFLAVLAVAVAGGIAFYLVSANEERQKQQAVPEKQQEVLDDLYYVYRYNFVCSYPILDVIGEAKDDPTKYTRVDFYDERPAGFEFGEVEDGVVVAFPSGTTQNSLDNLNSAIGRYRTEATALDFDPEVTMHDMVHRRAEVQALVDEMDAITRNDIYSPKVDIMLDLDYASNLNFTFYANSGNPGEFDGPGMTAEVKDKPGRYTRIELYDAPPVGFELEKIGYRVIMAFPTERTQKSLDRLNALLQQYNIDPASVGLGPEITVHDAVHDPEGVQSLFYKIQGATPEETAALRDSIYDPE